MEQDNVEVVNGSRRPSDIFEPHMPDVYLLPDMDAVFRDARARFRGGGAGGELAVAIVQPDRTVAHMPCPPPGSMADEAVKISAGLMPPDPPLDIAVVSYTLSEALALDKTLTGCIPFIGFLVGFAYIGHSVLVFEGHPTAFESGVRDCDVLIVDSGMEPFMQADWGGVAFRVMRPGAKIFVHKRDTFALMPVARSRNAQGWQYSERDGEASYTNSLLTTLANAPGGGPARITPGLPLPDLAGLTTDPDELDWIAGMPFKYDELDADTVIELLKHVAGWQWYHNFARSKSFHTRLVFGADESRYVSFTLSLSKDAEGRRQFTVERS